MDEPNMLHELGVEGTKGLVNIDHFLKRLVQPSQTLPIDQVLQGLE